jgi:hypothetical protein
MAPRELLRGLVMWWVLRAWLPFCAWLMPRPLLPFALAGAAAAAYAAWRLLQ